jgi:hypothetical protein
MEDSQWQAIRSHLALVMLITGLFEPTRTGIASHHALLEESEGTIAVRFFKQRMVVLRWLEQAILSVGGINSG